MPPIKPGSRMAAMAAKLRRAGHRSRYRLRRQTVEPVIGQIKHCARLSPVPLAWLQQGPGRVSAGLHAHNLTKLLGRLSRLTRTSPVPRCPYSQILPLSGATARIRRRNSSVTRRASFWLPIIFGVISTSNSVRSEPLSVTPNNGPTTGNRARKGIPV